jgi:REP element-mobilizing transposase RayT
LTVWTYCAIPTSEKKGREGMPRQARLDAPSALHHVIVRGIERRKIVDDDKDRENFVNRMGALTSETDTAVYAWALLPNLAHILLRSAPLGLSETVLN